MRLRAARSEEAGALTQICIESKAHWGYDAGFLALCRPALTVTAEMVASGEVLVAAGEDDRPLGVAALGDRDASGLEVALLFVHPAAMGRGVGRALFEALCRRARAAGARRLSILSDPGAEAFYLRMGARRLGEAPSDVIAGRLLPLLQFDL